jgi:hypothetical protein
MINSVGSCCNNVRITQLLVQAYKKGCTRLAAASDKVYQLLAHGQWFSPGTPASSTSLPLGSTFIQDTKKLKIKNAPNCGRDGEIKLNG